LLLVAIVVVGVRRYRFGGQPGVTPASKVPTFANPTFTNPTYLPAVNPNTDLEAGISNPAYGEFADSNPYSSIKKTTGRARDHSGGYAVGGMAANPNIYGSGNSRDVEGDYSVGNPLDTDTDMVEGYDNTTLNLGYSELPSGSGYAEVAVDSEEA